MTVFCLKHRIVLATKVLLPWIAILFAIIVLCMKPVQGGVIISGTGRTLVSGNGGAGSVYRAVSAQATLAISGSTLSLVLENTSAKDTTDPAEALSSFYFDIVREGLRPTLAYRSADGLLYKLLKDEPDEAYRYTPPTKPGESGRFRPGAGSSDLRALKAGDGTWQFKTMDPAKLPFQGFGIGTVGNSALAGNGFSTDLVGKGKSMIDFSIYHGGDVEPNGSLKEAYLLKNSGTFTFTFTDGNGWSEADIRPAAVFGFGTSPDGSIVVVPEPSAYALSLLGAAMLAWRQRARFRRHSRHSPTS
jgi:hypothetical protein